MHVRGFDAADETAVKGVVDEAVERYGRLDVFFANAGISGGHAAFEGVEGEEFMRVMRTNGLG